MTSVFLVSLILLLATGVPIFYVLSAAVGLAMWVEGGMPMAIVAERLFAGLDKFSLMAIPFFILTGNLMTVGGLSRRLVHLANLLVGRVTGGLGITAVCSCMFFGAISGSSPATVVAVGSMMYPSLLKGGYGNSFSIGVLIASGSLGIIIPPSIVMIVYAAVTGVSVGALFIAGVGAGIAYGLCFIVYSVYYAWRNDVPRSEVPPWATIGTALIDASWGLGVPIVVLGGIYAGVFTPTEAAAVSVVYALFVSAVIYREKTIAELWKTILDSASATAQIMIILAAASVLSWYLTANGLALETTEAMLGLSNDPVIILMLINAAVLIAGMFIDAASIMVILGPLLYKVGMQIGVDPIHLGIILTVNGAIGMFTPPFGLNLFVASSLGDVSYGQAVRGAIPFIFLGIIGLIIVTYVPAFSMWLPNQVYQGL
jgi:C4-dicarboxylate transporter DctM subunit